MSDLENRLLGSIPVAAYVTDARGRIIYCNDAAVDLLGYRPDGGTVDSCALWRMSFPDDQPIANGDLPVAAALAARLSPAGCPIACRRPDGSWAELLLHSAPTRD
ncbi:PAS domain-containing protein, partial [Rhizobiaceae sp. 2RAB30]